MRQWRIAFGALIAAIVVSAIPARAAVISQSNIKLGSTFQFGTFGGNFSQFDPSLGVLDGVTLQFFGQQIFTTTFDRIPDCSGCLETASYGYSVGYSYNAPGFPITVPYQTASFVIINNVFGFVNGSDLSPRIDTRNFATGLFFSDVSALSAYIGLGQVFVDGRISEDSDFCNAFGLVCHQSNSVNLTTRLTYNFTPVPEPSTWAMMLMGMGALGVARRKKRLAA